MRLRAALFALGMAACGWAVGQGASSPRSLAPTGAAQPGPSTEWVAVRGQAADLAISPDGDVYALDPSGKLWKLPSSEVRAGGSGWLTQPGPPGGYKRIRATHDKTMWAIDANNTLYRLRGSVWYRVLESVLDITASPDGQALTLSMDGRLFDPVSQQPFQPIPPESTARIESLLMDVHGLPWIQREDRSVTRFDGTAWKVVAAARDQLVSVNVGFDGAVMGVAADGRILNFAPLNNTWQAYVTDGRAVPPMRQIAISPVGLPWGISLAGNLVAERSLSKTPPPAATSPSLFTRLLTWRSAGGVSNRVSVGHDGTVFSTAPDGKLWQRKRGNEWSNIPFTNGQIRALAAGTEGRGWVLNDKAELFPIDRGFLSPALPSPGQIRLIAGGPKGLLWAVLLDNQVSNLNPVTRQWEPKYQLPETAQAFSVGMRDEPWFINTKGEVKTRRTTGNAVEWTIVEGIKAVSIGVGPEGTVYATSDDEGIYWLDAREMRWKPASGKAVQIAVGPGGAPWAITAKNELLASGRFLEEQQAREVTQSQTRTPTSTTSTTTSGTQAAAGQGTQTTTTPGTTITVTGPQAATTKPLVFETIAGTASFSDIGISTGGSIFAVSTEGALMCFNNIAKSFVLASAGRLSRVAVAPDGLPWILDSTGLVSRFDRTRAAWQTVPNFTGVDISFGPDGQLWAAGSGGGVYRYNANAASFVLVPITSSDVSFRPRRVAGATAGVHWVVTEQSQLVRCQIDSNNNNVCRVELIGATDASVAPDNTLFVLDLVGNILRYDPAKKSFEKQNGQGSAIAVGPGGLPWVVTSAGKVSASGMLAANNKTINAPDCATTFAAAPAPAAPTSSVRLVAAADSATLAPGASLNLLANDTFAGRAASTSDVTVSLESASSLLTLNGGSLVVAGNATAGAVINGRYRMCALSAPGNCANATFAITVAGTTVAPTGVTAIAGNGNATVSFTVPAGYAGVTVSGYSVTANPGSMTANGASSPITVTGLTNGTAYTFTVTVRYSNGTTKVSEASTPVTPTALTVEPSAPTVGTAVAGNAQATISFTAPASNGGSAITGYTVSSSPGGITASGAASPITVTGLVNGTPYTFTVRARNAIGLGAPSQSSNSVTPSLVTAPGAPTIGTATAGNAQASVSFSAPASTGGSPITSYRVTSSPGGIVATGTASPIVVTGLTNGTAYTFTVSAINAIGSSLSSAASASVTPTGAATVPGAPTIGAATPGNASVSVAFGAPASNGGSAITSYTVTSNPGGVTASGAASPLVVAGLTNGTAYTFTVTATNAIGTGAASAASASATPATVPGAPTGVSASVAGPGALSVAFSAPASTGGSAITGYTVTSAPGGFTASGPASPLVVPGLTGGTPYTFTVTATNALGTGPASTASANVTAVDLPSAPQGFGGAGAAGPAINLSWSAPASNGGAAIAQYAIQCMPTGANPPVFANTAGTSISLVHDGVTTIIISGETYNCQIGAENTVFVGMPGAPASAAPILVP